MPSPRSAILSRASALRRPRVATQDQGQRRMTGGSDCNFQHIKNTHTHMHKQVYERVSLSALYSNRKRPYRPARRGAKREACNADRGGDGKSEEMRAHETQPDATPRVRAPGRREVRRRASQISFHPDASLGVGRNPLLSLARGPVACSRDHTNPGWHSQGTLLITQ